MKDWTLNEDLAGTTCQLGDCLNVADVIAEAAGHVPDDYGFTPEEQDFRIAILLCMDHAHMTRGVSSLRFNSMRE
jgi:hypothetical protein